MPYVNVGASIDTGSGVERIKSKKALREHLRDNPGDVRFDVTTAPELMRREDPKEFRGNEVPAGVTLTVAGPDPYTARKWYASVALVKNAPRVTA